MTKSLGAGHIFGIQWNDSDSKLLLLLFRERFSGMSGPNEIFRGRIMTTQGTDVSADFLWNIASEFAWRTRTEVTTPQVNKW
jgi:hypothetical protein